MINDKQYHQNLTTDPCELQGAADALADILGKPRIEVGDSCSLIQLSGSAMGIILADRVAGKDTTNLLAALKRFQMTLDQNP